MSNKVIAIMYDFDKTLCTKDMQEYTFIPNLGMSPSEFWQEANRLREEEKMDQVLTYMYLMHKKMQDNGKILTRKYLEDIGKDVELFPGVETWFERINAFGKENGVIIEHYIISSGLKEIITGSTIGKYFKSIYASEFIYDEKENAVWPKLAINYTNKTQFLIRIKKGITDPTDDYSINRRMEESKVRIPTNNMIYIGDGMTDVPCMKLTKEGGGVSIAVYTEKSKNTAKSLKDDMRVNHLVIADYSEGSKMDTIVKKSIQKMALKMDLDDM